MPPMLSKNNGADVSKGWVSSFSKEETIDPSRGNLQQANFRNFTNPNSLDDYSNQYLMNNNATVQKDKTLDALEAGSGKNWNGTVVDQKGFANEFDKDWKDYTGNITQELYSAKDATGAIKFDTKENITKNGWTPVTTQGNTVTEGWQMSQDAAQPLLTGSSLYQSHDNFGRSNTGNYNAVGSNMHTTWDNTGYFADETQSNETQMGVPDWDRGGINLSTVNSEQSIMRRQQQAQMAEDRFIETLKAQEPEPVIEPGQGLIYNGEFVDLGKYGNSSGGDMMEEVTPLYRDWAWKNNKPVTNPPDFATYLSQMRQRPGGWATYPEEIIRQNYERDRLNYNTSFTEFLNAFKNTQQITNPEYEAWQMAMEDAQDYSDKYMAESDPTKNAQTMTNATLGSLFDQNSDQIGTAPSQGGTPVWAPPTPYEQIQTGLTNTFNNLSKIEAQKNTGFATTGAV